MNRTGLLPLALLVAGCGDLGDLDEFLPTVTFDRLDVEDVTWQNADTSFVFDVNNPNPLEIALARFDYALSFAGVEWLTGDDPDGLVLAAEGSSEMELPVSIVFGDLYEMVQATRGLDTVDFRLEGSFGFDTPVGTVDLPYDAEGGFPALRTPTFAFDRLRVTEIDLKGATAELDLDVDNDHGSNLWFTDFAYDVVVEGYDVGGGSVDDLGTVPGASTETLSVPVEVDFSEAGMAVYEALTKDEVRVGLQASTDVDTPFGVVPLTVDEKGNVSVQ